jgi:protein-disulfide isomerase
MRWAGALVMVLAACSAAPPASPPTQIATLAPVPTATAVPQPTPPPVVLEPRTPAGDYFLGRADAPVTLEIFGDFQCPVCGEFARTEEPTLLHDYVDTGKVRFVWHDYTWIGDESLDAAQAARCAGNQGHFWDYHNYLYSHQRGENLGQFSPANLESFAASLGLDQRTFNACLEGGQDGLAIRNALQQGVGMGIDVTPAFLVNGDLKIGAPPLNRLTALMEYYLAYKSR